MRPITAIATPASPSAMVFLDPWQGSVLGVQVVPAGGATFTVDYSFDDPNDVVNPVALGSMFFDTSLVPPSAIGGAVGTTFSIAMAPTWMRIRLLNGVGSVRATFFQPAFQSFGGGPTGPSIPRPINSVAPVISGSTSIGSVLTTTNGTWSGSPSSFAYQWQRGGTAIPGANAFQYTLVVADGGTSITCLVTATNAGGSASSPSNAISVPAVIPVNTGAPVVTGTAAVGATLSTTNGTWTNSPTGFAYQWQRGGTNISGAISSTYVVQAGDVGLPVSCVVTASNASGNGTAASNAITIVAAPTNTVAPVASGGTLVGQTLTTTNGTWTGSPTFTYQWLRDGANISGATSSTYLLASADATHLVSCAVTATNVGGSATANSNAISVTVAAPTNTVAPVVSGAASVGSTLTTTNGTWTGSPTFTYQWLRDGGNISGATASTYVVVSADQGHSVSCAVTGTNAGGSATAGSNSIAISASFSFPAGATAIFSTRKAVSSYAGMCLQLQNNTAGTPLDIGFDGTGNIDTAAALAFMAVSNGVRIVKWYDQSGNGRDAISSVPSNTTLNIVNGRGIVVFAGALFTVQPGPSDAGVIPSVNGDQTLGLVMWPDNSAVDQFVLTHYSGTGWMVMTNHGGNPYKGIYWSATPGAFSPTTAKLTTSSPTRLVYTRTSGALAMYLNGAASGTATGQSNSAPTSHICIGGYQDTSPGFGGFISEVFIYGSALSTGQLSTIDANEAATFPTIGLETPYNGQTSWAQLAPNSIINLGNVLQYEYTQPWTCFAAIQVYDPTNYKIIFTNVPAAGPAYPGYELWIDNTNGFQVLHVKLMHDYGGLQFAGIWGSVNVVDGKKHIVAASWDGSGTAAGISLFVDGVKDTSIHVESDTLGGRTIIGAGQSFLVGQQQAQSFGLGGGMSYFQLDNVKRSDAYIAGIFPGSGTPVPPVDANTAVLLKLNEGTGTTANDTSGHSLNGTMSDAGMWTP